MGHHIFELIRQYLAEYGYWTVAIALLLENAGLPVPGETILLTASFLAFSEHRLHLPSIIAVGVLAATIGDNIGFLIGHFGGRPLLTKYGKYIFIRPQTIEDGEKLFARYGAGVVFVARFIAGLRVIAGPLAGVLRLHWRKFAIFNFLGALLWVSVISGVGYLFGRHWEKLVEIIKNVNLIVFVAAGIVVAILWWQRRRRAAASDQKHSD
jgi:membrane protein DedA with SNARE-associated domain